MALNGKLIQHTVSLSNGAKLIITEGDGALHMSMFVNQHPGVTRPVVFCTINPECISGFKGLTKKDIVRLLYDKHDGESCDECFLELHSILNPGVCCFLCSKRVCRACVHTTTSSDSTSLACDDICKICAKSIIAKLNKIEPLEFKQKELK